MRHIQKPAHAQGPYCLQQKFDQGTPIDPTKAWKNLGSDCKQTLIEYYLKPEQYCLCAYSEVELETFGCHIEHIKPKDKNRYPQYTFDYHNLIASNVCPGVQGEPCTNNFTRFFVQGSPCTPGTKGVFKNPENSKILKILIQTINWSLL